MPSMPQAKTARDVRSQENEPQVDGDGDDRRVGHERGQEVDPDARQRQLVGVVDEQVSGGLQELVADGGTAEVLDRHKEQATDDDASDDAHQLATLDVPDLAAERDRK